MSRHMRLGLFASMVSMATMAFMPGGDGVGGTMASAAEGTVYVDSSNGFRIAYPSGFVVRPQDVARLAQLSPTPVASVLFMNPVMAGGALSGLEPADLEVRVYRAGVSDSLKGWLVSVGLASRESAAAAQPYRNAGIGGLKVCAPTMIAPGCSVYTLRGGRVYQLTPASVEGQSMIDTLMLLP